MAYELSGLLHLVILFYQLSGQNFRNNHIHIKTLKAFEQFLEEAHLAAKLGNKLEDGYTIKIS